MRFISRNQAEYKDMIKKQEKETPANPKSKRLGVKKQKGKK